MDAVGTAVAPFSRMQPGRNHYPDADPPVALAVRVCSPEVPLAGSEVRRLAYEPVSPARLRHMQRRARLVALEGTRLVGLACYERIDDVLQVHELLFERARVGPDEAVTRLLLDTLETAALACGATRLLVSGRVAAGEAVLSARGYRRMGTRTKAWFEKRLP